MEFSIETFGLTKAYEDKVAVREIDLRVPRGSFFGFLGPNGAGKSTTIKMLTGLTAPTRGEARILGYALAKSPLLIKRRVGVVPEDLGLFDNLTAREYLTFIGRMYRMPPQVAVKRMEELLELLGLAPEVRTLTFEYSHGMKKKLALAAALIHDPDLLFLDEPFEGVDAIASRTIRQVLDRIVARGATVFLTSHVLEVVEKLCTHVGIIAQGQLAVQGTLEEVAQGGSLEDAFVRVAGGLESDGVSLSWLAGPSGC